MELPTYLASLEKNPHNTVENRALLDNFLFLFGRELEEPLLSLCTHATLCGLDKHFEESVELTVRTRDLHRVISDLCVVSNTPMGILHGFFESIFPITLGDTKWKYEVKKPVKLCNGLNFTAEKYGVTSYLTFIYPEAPAAYFVFTKEAYILVTTTDKQLVVKRKDYTVCIDGLAVEPNIPMDNKAAIEIRNLREERILKKEALRALEDSDYKSKYSMLHSCWAFPHFPLPRLNIRFDKVRARAEMTNATINFAV